jgi:hypothetical protein
MILAQLHGYARSEWSGFRAEAVTKGGFPVINSPDNGERVHSLLWS